MSGPDRLLDSVILIDHLNGVSVATDCLREAGDHGALSVITRAEVLAGSGHEERELVDQLLGGFVTLEMTVPVADLAADCRRQAGWKLPDAIQAAFARFHQLQLITRNTRDFPPNRYPFVSVPYQL